MWQKHPYLPIECNPNGCTRYIRTMIETFGRKSRKGYKRISLSNGKYKRKDYFVHRLIAETFIPNTENKPFINHINGVTSDNRIENLEWCTIKENARHCVDILKTNYNPMLGKFGKEHNRSKSVKVLKDGNLIGVYGSIYEIGRELNIGISNICSVLKGKRKQSNGFNFEYA